MRPGSRRAIRKLSGDFDDLDLDEKERKFVDAYILEPNGTKAAAIAGYANPQKHASAVRWRPRVAEAIARRMKAAEIKADIKAVEILTELKVLALSNLGAHYFERGPNGMPKLRDWDTITDAQKAALKQVKIETETVRSKANPDSQIERTVITIQAHDKEGPLHLLAKYLRLIDDGRSDGTTINQQNTVIFADALSAARTVFGNAAGRGSDS